MSNITKSAIALAGAAAVLLLAYLFGITPQEVLDILSKMQAGVPS